MKNFTNCNTKINQTYFLIYLMQIRLFHDLWGLCQDLLPTKLLPATSCSSHRGPSCSPIRRTCLILQTEHLSNTPNIHVSLKQVLKVILQVAECPNSLWTPPLTCPCRPYANTGWSKQTLELGTSVCGFGRSFVLQSRVTSKSMCGSHTPVLPLATLGTFASFQLRCHAALPAKLPINVVSTLGSGWPVVTAQ